MRKRRKRKEKGRRIDTKKTRLNLNSCRNYIEVRKYTE